MEHWVTSNLQITDTSTKTWSKILYSFVHLKKKYFYPNHLQKTADFWRRRGKRVCGRPGNKTDFWPILVPRVPKRRFFTSVFPIKSKQVNFKLFYHQIMERMHRLSIILTDKWDTSFSKNFFCTRGTKIGTHNTNWYPERPTTESGASQLDIFP